MIRPRLYPFFGVGIESALIRCLNGKLNHHALQNRTSVASFIFPMSFHVVSYPFLVSLTSVVKNFSTQHWNHANC